MSEAIKGLQPELLWQKFAEVTAIPRPSKHEERIAAHVLASAARLGLEAHQDACGNILVRKPASAGREESAPICLQAHLDMVPEKNAEKNHDFLKDPIELVRKGEVITANGTTLGADNGIGIATSLAIMEDPSLTHGPLEFLFTIDEETGLTGAQNLDPTLVRSRILLNLDSEDEGILFVGCAGGRDTLGRWALHREAVPSGSVALHLSVKGLKGGHSGLDIGRGLGNAIKIANRALRALSDLGGRVASIKGGNMRNAIPRECEALLFLPAEKEGRGREVIERLNQAVAAEYATADPALSIRLSQTEIPAGCTIFEKAQQERIFRAISGVPHGVLEMSQEIPGLVETSTNLAVVTTTQEELVLVTSQRSSVASRLGEAVAAVVSVLELAEARVESGKGYPGWQPNLRSPILLKAKACYQALFGQEPKVQAIHAGLECGIIGERIPGMDMVSFGPTLAGVHSPDERIDIESVGKYWAFLLEILAKSDR